MENTIYLSSAYLAPVEYYTKLFACEKAYVEQYDNYVKQTYRNRCVIAAADGPLALTIPTEKSGTPKCLMRMSAFRIMAIGVIYIGMLWWLHIETVLSLSTMLMISTSFMKRNMPSCGIIIRKFVL